MSIRSWLCGIACAPMFLGLSAATAQGKEASGGVDEMTKLWMAAATPGEFHKRLNDLVGNWETVSKTWSEGPDKPPVMGKGKAEVKWILGGRFVQQIAEGELMGMPFTGVGITGYDNLSRNYVSVWMDNSSTALFFSRGTMDSSGHVLSMYGTMDDPISGERGRMARYVTRFVNHDTIIFEMHDLGRPEKSTKVGEIVYSRTKP